MNNFYNFSTICCSDYCSYLIDSFNNLYTFGTNFSCKLGHPGSETIIFPPKQVSNLCDIKIVCCGSSFAGCCDYSGNVFTFGTNSHGQLGVDKSGPLYIPQQVDIPPIDMISCGMDFVICLSMEGSLYSFGNNEGGKLGYNKDDSSNKPQKIPDLYNIDYIICGGYHSFCKNTNNEFYCWGENSYGQLGNKSDNKSVTTPTLVNNWSDDIISLRCGKYHSVYLTSNGEIYTFGRNNYGQIGQGREYKSIDYPMVIKDILYIKRIESGCYHIMSIDIDNNLWLNGWNTFGELGLGDKSYRYKPVKHPTLTNIIDLSSGGYHTFVKTSENKIYTMGDNSKSQLGIKTKEKIIKIPKQVFIDNEDFWRISERKSRAKSARK